MASNSSGAGRKRKVKSAGTEESSAGNGVNQTRKTRLKRGTAPVESRDESVPKGGKGACSKGGGRKRKSAPEDPSEASDIPKKRRKSPAKRDTGKVSAPAKSKSKKKTATSTKGAARKQKATPKGPSQSAEPSDDSRQVSDVPSGVAQKGNTSQVTESAGKEEQSVAERRKANRPSYSRLPPEMLMEIFSYLGSEDLLLGAALVCQSWSKVAFGMLKDVILDGEELTVKRAALLVRALNKDVRKMQLQGWNGKMIDPILIAIGECLPDLESLTIDDEGYSGGSALAYVVAKCTKITELHIEVLPKEGRRHPLNCLPTEWNVSKFHISGSVFMIDQPDMSVARRWDTLKDVTIWYRESDNEFEFVVAACGHQLSKLRVSSLMKIESYMSLAKLQQLEELHLMSAGCMSDDCLLNAVATLTNLKHLTIHAAFNMTPEALYEFLSLEEVVGKLVTLELSYTCADYIHLNLIAAFCPHLTSLSIKGCNRVTIDPLLHLVEELPIKHLDLYGCFPMRKMIINIRKIKAVRPNITIDHTTY